MYVFDVTSARSRRACLERAELLIQTISHSTLHLLSDTPAKCEVNQMGIYS